MSPPDDAKRATLRVFAEVYKDNVPVYVFDEDGSVTYDANGKILRQEDIIDYTKSNILGKFASLDNFIRQWSAEEKKESIRDLLNERGIDLEIMKAEQNLP